MMKRGIGVGLLAGLCFLLCCAEVFAIGQTRYIQNAPSPGSFPLIQRNLASTLWVDSADWPGVIRAAGDLKSDLARVSGNDVPLTSNIDQISNAVIIIGTIGRSKVIDDLVKSGRIDVSQIRGKWESFLLQVVPAPLPGVRNGLIIAGSDKRGTIYGIYDLCEQIGVSPWYWWADVPVAHQSRLFVKAGKFQQGEPSVRYRGIFLNDESPDLSGWVAEKFGYVPTSEYPPIPANVANYNSQFYAKLFELILRLKGNYLWPAMWNNAFNEDDPENPRLADEYGIVMGTSHQEPMLRAQKEWDRRYRKILGNWNYYKNPDVLQAFWREGIRRNRNYESILTIGLRGADDTPMIPGGTVAQSMALLEEIVGVQRRMIAEEINPDVNRVPQLWCLYKEVQEYYKEGLRVPDDVTLLWADDNWGNLRRLPTEAERKRTGGAGIYYHFDYVGGPRNYKWINTNPIPKIWEQMTLAKEYGADRIWIVNVGHFKGLEFPIEYFMHLGWNTKQWTNSNIDEYTRLWAVREFGPAFGPAAAKIIAQYGKYNGRRKPELLEPTTYSLTDYREAEKMVADYKAITARAEAVFEKLPQAARDAFYQLVLFPAKACAQVNELYFAAGKNALYAQQGRAATNDMADQVESLFQADADLMNDFNHRLGNGKWNHFMDQVHIGYTIWQDPPKNVMPPIIRLQVPREAGMGIAVEGSQSAWPGSTGDPSLPEFDANGVSRHYFDIFNRGASAFGFTATPSNPWISISANQGVVEKEKRVWVAIDWNKAPRGSASGSVRVTREGGESLDVKIQSFRAYSAKSPIRGAFLEGDGVVSLEAEHYTRNIPAGSVRWERIQDYGKTLSAMTIMPVISGSVLPPQDSPRLEYGMYLKSAGDVTVRITLAPSLNFAPDRGIRMAVSFDDQRPQILEVLPPGFDARNGNREWEDSVKNSGRIVRSVHRIEMAGYHTLKIWMVDAAVVLQKIVVDCGGLKPSYLGPPESRRIDR